MSITLRVNRHPRDIFSKPRRHFDEQDVQNGLALTPAQMLDMQNRGIPIVPANLGVSYEEGADIKSFEVSPEHLRGIDLGDVWELRESTNKRFKSAIANVKPEGAE